MSTLGKILGKASNFADHVFGKKAMDTFNKIDEVVGGIISAYYGGYLGVLGHELLVKKRQVGMEIGRGGDERTAIRHGYQDWLKAAAITTVAYGIGYLASSASSTSGAATTGGDTAAAGGTGAPATPGTSTITGSTPSAGVTETPTMADAGGAADAAATPAPTGGTPPTIPKAPTGGVPTFGDKVMSGAKAVGKTLNENQLLTYGLLQVGGSALAGANQPTQAEEYNDILEAKRRANAYSSGVAGGVAPTYSAYPTTIRPPTGVLSPQQMLSAGGFASTPGLLQTQPNDTSIIKRAGYG